MLIVVLVLSVQFTYLIPSMGEVVPLIIYPGLDGIAVVMPENTVFINPSCIVQANTTYTDVIRLRSEEGYTNILRIANLTLNPVQIYEFQISAFYSNETILLYHYRDGTIIQNNTLTLFSGTEAIMSISIMTTVTQLGAIDPITYEIAASYGARDRAVISVLSSKTEAYEGEIIDIAVTVKNEGTETDTFDVTAYYGCGGIPIGTETVADLAPYTSTTIVFKWNTTGVRPCVVVPYTIWAVAAGVPEEITLDNNLCIGGKVKIKMLGDITSDGIVDIFDLVTAAGAYGSVPGNPNWKWQADLNRDGIVDIFDIVIVALNYGRLEQIIEVIDHIVVKGGSVYHVVTESNSTVSDFAFNESEKEVSFNVKGLCGATGFCWVTTPYELLGPLPYTVLVDDIKISATYLPINITHVQVKFTYSFPPAIRKVQIIGPTT